MQITFSRLFMLILLFLSVSAFSQKERYQGLLWQISGGELAEPSYLYGTMHVSERVAFHLSDVFFEKLLKTDYVALESNPETWLEERANSSERFFRYNQGLQSNLYKSFALNIPAKRDLARILRMNSYLANGILYRTQDSRRDYQEQTYLDMFLYQTAKRTQRDVLALEDNKESRELVRKATVQSRETDVKPWAKRLLKNTSYREAMQEAYRTGDLDRLDSLNLGFNTKDFMEYMLYQRNTNMVTRMDSLLQAGKTLFSGVGAAHLPGEKGMIALLRKSGYTVTPLSGEFNRAARNQKEKIDTLFVKPKYEQHFTSDSLVQVAAPTKFYATGSAGFEYAYSLDVVNGAQVYVLRQNWNDFLVKNPNTNKRQKIDSLFFENIPGRILEKKEITVSGYPAFHIKNETANGNNQEHITILTPLELIHVSLLGQKNFVRNMPDWWRSISVTSAEESKWRNYQPKSQHFRVALPAYAKIINADGLNTVFMPKEIYAYDPKSKEYFFLIERNISEWNFLEDSGFEQQMIHDAIYESAELDSVNTTFINGDFYSESKQKKPFLRLKSKIHGSNYFVLGTNAKANTFFDSFRIKEPVAYKEWQDWNNRGMSFEAKIPYEPEKEILPGELEEIVEAKKEVNYFEQQGKREVVLLPGGKSVELRTTRFHAYDEFPTLDSLWTEMARRNRELLTYEVKNERQTTFRSMPIWEAEYTDTASVQKIKARYFLKASTLYSAKSVVSYNYKNEDPNLEYFFANFTPKDTLRMGSIFTPKTPKFYKDIRSSYDSIRHSAKLSFDKIEFGKSDIQPLMELIDSLGTESEHIEFVGKIASSLGEMADASIVPFLSKTYRKQTGNAEVQISILAAMAEQNTPAAYDSINRIMREDLPLTNVKSYDFLRFFSQLKEQSYNKKQILDLFMSFVPIPEYQYHVLDWLGTAIQKKEITPGELAPYSDEILFNAQLQVKRAQAKVQRRFSDEEPIYPFKFAELEAYLNIFPALAGVKEVDVLQAKIKDLDAPSLQMARALRMGLENKAIRADVIDRIGAIPRFTIELYDSLYVNNKLHTLPKSLTLKRLVDLYARVQADLETPENQDKLKFHTQEIHTFGGKKWVIRMYKAEEIEAPYGGQKKNLLLGIGFWLDEKGNLVPKSVREHRDFYEIIDDLPDTVKKIRNAILFEDKPRVYRF